MAITLGKREHRFEVEVEGQTAPLTLVMRHMTAAEKTEFRSGARKFAALGDKEKREAMSDEERGARFVEFEAFAVEWVARLVTRAENLVLGGEPQAWSESPTERADLLTVCGEALVLEAYAFLGSHCAGIAETDRGN